MLALFSWKLFCRQMFLCLSAHCPGLTGYNCMDYFIDTRIKIPSTLLHQKGIWWSLSPLPHTYRSSSRSHKLQLYGLSHNYKKKKVVNNFATSPGHIMKFITIITFAMYRSPGTGVTSYNCMDSFIVTRRKISTTSLLYQGIWWSLSPWLHTYKSRGNKLGR